MTISRHYFIVTSNSKDDLEDKVTEMFREGYELCGNLVISNLSGVGKTMFYQPMVYAGLAIGELRATTPLGVPET